MTVDDRQVDDDLLFSHLPQDSDIMNGPGPDDWYDFPQLPHLKLQVTFWAEGSHSNSWWFWQQFRQNSNIWDVPSLYDSLF